MCEESSDFDSFNYCENMKREELEAIVNSLIAPIYKNRDLFLQDDSAEFAAEEKFRFWMNWLEAVSQQLGGFNILNKVEFPNPRRQKLEITLSHLDAKQFEELSSIIDEYKQKHAQITEEYKDELHHEPSSQRIEKLSSIEDHFEKQIDNILSGSKINHQDIDYDFLSVNAEDWFGLTAKKRSCILRAIYEKKRSILELDSSHKKPSIDNLQPSLAFQEYGQIYAETHKKLTPYIGEENVDELLGNGVKAFDVFDNCLSIEQCFEQLKMELMLIANGDISDSVKLLTSKSRGERKDSFILQKLKSEIGFVYRALRHSNASSDQAVTAINKSLADFGLKRQMTKDAISKRAPRDLSELHPGDLIHRNLPVIEGEDLVNYVDETFEDCLHRHAKNWLGPYIEHYLRLFRN